MTVRTALVTGANRGIGEQIARGLAKHGLHVLVGSRERSSGDNVAASINDHGGSAETVTLDVSDRSSIASVASTHPEIDVLVNNAGMLDEGRLLDLSEDTLAMTTAVNGLGPLFLIRAMSPGMAKRGYGRIVNVSSGWGALNNLGPGAYGVTKAYLNAITIKAASELPNSVKVNAMCPGWVRTRMGGPSASRSPEEGADTGVWLATLPDTGPTGGFFRDRQAISWMDG
ncbi:MAG: SDR family NAD(P)-dependent oxidoreductase [Pseudomonadota bacterium]